MNRREFSISLAGVAVAGTACGQGGAANLPREGSDYLLVEPRAAVEAPAGKIEVVEFFWYSCPHCNAFEPALEQWIKRAPKDVVVRRVPVRFRADFEAQQRLYYTLEAMGRVEDLHRKVFTAIHGERVALNNTEQIAAWIEKQGVERAKFLETFQSFGVAGKARRAAQLQDMYKLDGVPSLGIAGRYFTSGSLAQNMDRALAVTDYLIAVARKTR